ncbi:hypothetical protein PoB_002995200 [Plakobranchus ocellatus]|uniref:Uncharacterized protein n=1 Tax=Plakobranchus ocellatus TaxID=259542 RepID=A0AAV4A977_9GAST|nr:hypothetical protein PoB_002995200 [Plakobranchus ocellatus]
MRSLALCGFMEQRRILILAKGITAQKRHQNYYSTATPEKEVCVCKKGGGERRLPELRPSPHRAYGRSGEAPVMKSGRKPKFFHKSKESPLVWGTRNFTACSKQPGTSLGRSSGESPRLGRCVQVEKTKRLDCCAAIAGALPPQRHGRCGLGLTFESYS